MRKAIRRKTRKQGHCFRSMRRMPTGEGKRRRRKRRRESKRSRMRTPRQLLRPLALETPLRIQLKRLTRFASCHFNFLMQFIYFDGIIYFAACSEMATRTLFCGLLYLEIIIKYYNYPLRVVKSLCAFLFNLLLIIQDQWYQWILLRSRRFFSWPTF